MPIIINPESGFLRHETAAPLLFAVAAVAVAVGQVTAVSPSHGGAADGALLGRWELTSSAGAGAMPKGVEDCAMVYDSTLDRVIVVGGKDDRDFNTNETWAFDVGARVWTPLKTSGPRPPTGEDHTAIFDPPGNRLLLYGGENGMTTNKLWALELKTLTWRDLTNPAVPRRESHTAVYDGRSKRMVVFGGLDRTAADLHDIWSMDLDPGSAGFETWQNLTVEEGRPPGRMDHSAVYDPRKNRMVFNGGWSKARKAIFGDTWAFNFADSIGGKGSWAKLAGGQRVPPERRHGAAVYDSERNLFVVFGGMGRDGLYRNDIWAFDLTRDEWAEIVSGDPRPRPRIDHRAVFDSRRGSMLMYGGDGGRPHGKLHEMWTLTLSPGSTHGH